MFVKTIIVDLNGDGRKDIALFTNTTINGNDVVVMYQGSDGTFKTFASYNSVADLGLAWVTDIAAGDLNGDGRTDLAVVGRPVSQPFGWGPPLTVLYQTSMGNFGTPIRYDVSPSESAGGHLAVGDLNADWRDDVVISGGRPTVVLQSSNGSLGTDANSVFKVNSNKVLFYDGEVHIADMNSDGYNDLVVQNGSKEIGVLRQTSPGVFSSAIDHYQVVTSYWSSFNTFAVGDVNGDGKADVVTLDPGNNGYLNIFLQNASGTLDAPQLMTITSSPLYGIEIADVNKDGLNDIVGNVVDAGIPNGIGQVRVFYQKSDHTIQDAAAYTFPTDAGGGSMDYESLSIGDVNGDGWPDAVVAWMGDGIFVLLNKPN